MTWEQARGAFERYLRVERNVSPNTLRAYLADWKDFARFAAEQGLPRPGAVSKRAVRHWLATLHRERSAATIARKMRNPSCWSATDNRCFSKQGVRPRSRERNI